MTPALRRKRGGNRAHWISLDLGDRKRCQFPLSLPPYTLPHYSPILRAGRVLRKSTYLTDKETGPEKLNVCLKATEKVTVKARIGASPSSDLLL